LAFHAEEEVFDPVIWLQVCLESGLVITEVSTRSTGDIVPTLVGGGSVDYVQDPCRLNPGTYKLNVSILDSTGRTSYDAWRDALDLVVRTEQRLLRGGLVSLPDAFDTTAAVRQAEAGPGDVTPAGSR
jgi:hypothetical protein